MFSVKYIFTLNCFLSVRHEEDAAVPEEILFDVAEKSQPRPAAVLIVHFSNLHWFSVSWPSKQEIAAGETHIQVSTQLFWLSSTRRELGVIWKVVNSCSYFFLQELAYFLVQRFFFFFCISSSNPGRKKENSSFINFSLLVFLLVDLKQRRTKRAECRGCQNHYTAKNAFGTNEKWSANAH